MVTNNFGCSRATSSVSLTQSSNVQDVDAQPNFNERSSGDTDNCQVILYTNVFYYSFDAATDSNCYANVTCYNCGKKGHNAPNCPDKKNGKSNAGESNAGNNKPVLGNAARTTTDPDDNSTEIVFLAHHM